MAFSNTYLRSRTPRELAGLAALPLGRDAIKTGHKGFNAEANHLERGYVGTGNVMSGVQRSTFVRAKTKTRCNGFTFLEGELRESDMKMFGSNMPGNMRQRVEALSEDQDLIIYEFSSPMQGGQRSIHGWLITDTFYRHIETASLPGQKSMSVMHDMERRLSWSDKGMEDPETVSGIVQETRDVTGEDLTALAESLGRKAAFDPAGCRDHRVYYADENPISAFCPDDPAGTLVRSDSASETAAMLCIRANLSPEDVRARLDDIRGEPTTDLNDGPGM